MSKPSPDHAVPTACAVSVIMQRSDPQQSRWGLAQWTLIGIVAGQTAAEGRGTRTCVRSEDGVEQYLYTGFSLPLYRDGAESYWYNLVGQTPSLFVACREGESGELEPFAVSANYDEAGAYMEADDTVYSTPMPPEIYQWIEQYVAQHFRPQERKKRKRENWSDEPGRSSFDRN